MCLNCIWLITEDIPGVWSKLLSVCHYISNRGNHRIRITISKPTKVFMSSTVTSYHGQAYHCWEKPNFEYLFVSDTNKSLTSPVKICRKAVVESCLYEKASLDLQWGNNSSTWSLVSLSSMGFLSLEYHYMLPHHLVPYSSAAVWWCSTPGWSSATGWSYTTG